MVFVQVIVETVCAWVGDFERRRFAGAQCAKVQFGFGGYGDIYASIAYQVGGGGSIFTEPYLLPDYTTTNVVCLTLGVAYGFGWDERGATLEDQVSRPIVDSREMGSSFPVLEGKLTATSFYPGLFAAAFGTPEITRDRIGRALAQFVRSLISAQSRFDAVFATGGAPDSSRLTVQEWRGFRLFNNAGCVNCHRTIALVADTANNIGLDSVSADTGTGRGHLKPSSLRNVAIRPPYMHDGRFTTLRQVVEFYSRGIQANPDLDARLRNADGTPRRMNFAPAEVDALVAFLNALTDSTFLVAERFSNPFACRHAG